LYEFLVEQFNQLAELNPEKERCLLVSTLEGYPEDDTNMLILSEAASDAGFEVDFQHIEKVVFSAKEGVFKVNEDGTYTRFDFWFKLVPWEYIAWDEPQLTTILTNLVCSGKTIVLNPAYVILFQSKAILKVLWDLFPNHPLLLACEDEPLVDKKSVEKVLFGREGANVRIIESSGATSEKKEGEYGEQRKIYQEYVPFLEDESGKSYQAGVFFAGEACGLGFRKGGKILDNQAQFCGHFIE
jgi:glutathionylspermidine synthase